MGTALQHNAQLAIQLTLLIFVTFPHYEVSKGHCVYCTYYKDKEPSSDRIVSAKEILIKTKAAAPNSSNDCFSYLITHGRRNSTQMNFMVFKLHKLKRGRKWCGNHWSMFFVYCSYDSGTTPTGQSPSAYHSFHACSGEEIIEKRTTKLLCRHGTLMNVLSKWQTK